MAEELVPAHAGSWGRAYPNVTGGCEQRIGTLNPLLNQTYDIVRQVFEEVFELFPDEYVHAGADEVTAECYWQVKDIAARLAQQGEWAVMPELMQRFMDFVFGLFAKAGKRPIIWQDLMEMGLRVNPGKVLIQPWKCVPDIKCGLADLLRNGHSTIQSTCFYLGS